MNIFMTALLFLITTTVFAIEKQAISLDMFLHIDGKLYSQRGVVSTSGKTIVMDSVSENGEAISIEVTPALEKSNNRVSMAFIVTKIEGNKKQF